MAGEGIGDCSHPDAESALNEPVIESATMSGPTNLAPRLRWVGHSGYVAEGIVYVLIGAFALVALLSP